MTGKPETPLALLIRRATADHTETIVQVLIASKEASFPDTMDEHDRDVAFWTRRWRDYLLRGSVPFQLFGDGWVFLAEVESQPVAYIAYHHTKRLGTDAEFQNPTADAAGEGSVGRSA